MKVAFRCDGSQIIGAGHVMRCKALADVLAKQGHDCTFVTSTESYAFVPGLAVYERMEPEPFYQDPVGFDVLVVDHYGCDATYQTRFRGHVKLIAVIDDLMDRRHDADVVHNQSYGVTPELYVGLLPEHCIVLAGPRYALMKPDFSHQRDAVLARRKTIHEIRRVLLNFGGNDQKNMILRSLEQLKQVGYRGAIDVAFGMVAPHRTSVEAFCKDMANAITFHISPDMVALMANADFAIGAPAVTQWERFAFGLPTLLVQTADNQSFAYGALLRDGFSAMASLDHLGDPGWLNNLDTQLYQSYVDRYAAQTVGSGASLFANVLQTQWKLRQ